MKKNVNKMEFDPEMIKILESVFDDILISDANGVIIQTSRTFKETYNTEENVIGKTVYDLEKEGVFKPSITVEVLKTKETVTKKQQLLDNKRLVATAVPIKDKEGNILKVISFSRDITEFYNLQKQYENLENKIERYSQEIKELRTKAFDIEGIVYESKIMEDILGVVKKVATFDTCVLLTGPTGVGKTLIAKRLHKSGDRKNGPFVDINCGAIPETLLESELFGYAEGAFTGANKGGKLGLIELANGGTLFLDEIGDLPLNLQVKLLKVIQDKKITPIGSTKEKSVDFRLVTASNRNIVEMIDEKKFREDLYYRINVISIDIPPLHERKEDVIALCRHFWKKTNEKYNMNVAFTGKATKYLIDYDWPGNVRQLENLIERAIIISENDIVTENDLPEDVIRKANEGIANSHLEYDGYNLSDIMEKVEEKVIREALKKHKTSQGVADALGISQPTAYRKISKYLK